MWISQEQLVIESSNIGSNNKHWDLTSTNMQTWELGHLTWGSWRSQVFIEMMWVCPEMGYGSCGLSSWGKSVLLRSLFSDINWWLSRWSPKTSGPQAVRGWEVGNNHPVVDHFHWETMGFPLCLLVYPRGSWELKRYFAPNTTNKATTQLGQTHDKNKPNTNWATV